MDRLFQMPSVWIVPTWMHGWPSLVVESAGGATLMLGLAWLHPPAVRWVSALAVSLAYERFIDPHGFSWADVLQRLPAMVGVEVLRYAL
jgi:hypothetical protein